ncbi:MAG: hypothetical protein OXC95_05660, partial [Dehalococcoidia bacterium]|nr:hypothetical protein [Dehalococcoidia bacterium]
MQSSHNTIITILRTDTMPLQVLSEMEMDISLSIMHHMGTSWTEITAENAFRTISQEAQERTKAAFDQLASDANLDPDRFIARDPRAAERLRRHTNSITQSVIRSLRNPFTKHYGFPVITEEAIVWMTERLRGHHPALEVGAGNGYLARRLRDAGADLIATDIARLEYNEFGLGNEYHNQIVFMDAKSAIETIRPSALIWSWPAYDQSSGDALAAFTGEIILYIGEQYDGCTGGPHFTNILEKRFKRKDHLQIPSFPGIYDSVG